MSYIYKNSINYEAPKHPSTQAPKLLLLISFLLYSFIGHTQNGCPSYASNIDPSYYQVDLTKASSNTFTVKLYWNIVADDNGQSPAIQANQLPAFQDFVDQIYAPHNIEFLHVCNTLTLNNSDLKSFSNDINTPLSPPTILCDLMTNGGFAHDDGIDLYLRDNFENNVLDIPSRFAFVNINNIDPYTISHEIGHCFGMLHPEYGSYNNPWLYPDRCYTNPEDPPRSCNGTIDGGCAEWKISDPNNIDQIITAVDPVTCQITTVNISGLGGNGKICGDLIESTPPSNTNHFKAHVDGIVICVNPQVQNICDGSDDIVLCVSNTGGADCCSNGDIQIIDAAKQPYKPNYNNIMAIFNNACPGGFNFEQGQVMRNFISTHPSLQGITTNVEYECDCNYSLDNVVNLNAFDFDTDANGSILFSNVISELGLSNPVENINFIVDEDLFIQESVEFKGVSFEFAEGKKLIANSNSGPLTLSDESALSTCGVQWEGLQVLSGTVNINNSTIENANVAIDLDAGTSLNMNDAIVHFSNVGIQVNNGASISAFDRNTLSNLTTGILATNNGAIKDIKASNIAIDFSTISQVTTGVDLRGQWNIGNIKIMDAEDGIIARESPFTRIDFCHINATNHGVLGENSILSMTRNIIGGNNDFGEFGIKIRNASAGLIFNNTAINASRIPIFLIRANNVTLDDNVIGMTPSCHSGIFVWDSDDVDIFDNNLSASSSRSGIRLNRSDQNRIEFNTLNGSDLTEGFSVLGSDELRSRNNTVNIGDEGSAFRLMNSPNSSLFCDSLNAGQQALLFDSNSDLTDVTANNLSGTTWDLQTFVELGRQENKGNIFYGGSVDASTLSDDEIERSAFIVNSFFTGHLPTDVNPEVWFKDEGLIPSTCSGNRSLPYDDEAWICSYVDRLEAKAALWPERYFIKMLHLLNFYENDTSYTLPACVINSIDSLDPCGLLLIKDILSIEGQINQEIDTSALNDVKFHEKERIPLGANIPYHEAKVQDIVYTSIEPNIQYIEALSDSIYMEVKAQISEDTMCTDSIALLWKCVLSIMADHFLSDSITVIQRTYLLSVAQLCSNEYGDAVNWARGFLFTFENDSTDYALFDGCHDVLEEREENSTLNESVSVNIYPNPNPGLFTIDFNLPIENATIRILDVSGRNVWEQSYPTLKTRSIQVDAPMGTYFVEIKSNTYYSTETLIISN